MSKNNTSANAIPVIPSLDIIKTFYRIGRTPDATFLLILSPPGCGKTSWMRANMSKESFLINGKIYGENTAAIPMVMNKAIDPAAFLEERERVAKALGECADPDLVNKITEKRVAGEKDVHMRPPRYFELEEFLLNYDREVYSPKKNNVPIIWVDEATQMTVEARDQLVTALVDGDLMKSLGIKWNPMVVMLANGRVYGGANNFPLSPRQVARCIQMIFGPEGTMDIPVDIPGINSQGAKNLRKAYHDKVVDDFVSGTNSISKAELPRNSPGNPRTMATLLWFVQRVKELNLQNPVDFLTTVVMGYVDSAEVNDALELVKSYFTDLPGSIEEVKSILQGKTPKPKNIKNVKLQEWISWAKYRSDGTPEGNAELARFAQLFGADEDTVNAIKIL